MPVRLLGTGAHVPARVVTNDEIALRCGVDPAWAAERIGYTERRHAADGEATSDLAVSAARQALDRAGVRADSVSLVICATCSPDHPFPSTAAILAERLGARGAAAFDLQAGCAGFVYATVLAAQALASGLARHALVVGADIVSRLVDPQDPATAFIFGDGAGAAVFGPARGKEGLLGIHLGSDGSGASLLHAAAGGSRLPPSRATPGERSHVLRMMGPALFKTAIRHSVAAARAALGAAGLAASDVQVLVPHQSSRRLIEATAEGCGIALDRVVMNLGRYGNTSCASLPIALDEASTTGRLAAGTRALLLGFGAGLSWGAALLRT